MKFVNLHCHCEHSVLDGLGSPKKWIEAAKSKGIDTFALTDHGSVSSAYEFYSEAKKQGINPIVGCEFYFTDDPSFRPKRKKGERMPRFHLIALAKSWNGLQSIFKQLSAANRQFYYKPLLSTEQIHDFENCIISSACAVGAAAHPEAEIIVERLKKTYGDDFYLEAMPHQLEVQKAINKRVVELSRKFNIKTIVTNDAHYPLAEDFNTHDVLLAIQTNAKLEDDKRFSFRPLNDLYLKTGAEMFESLRPWIADGTFDVPFVANSFMNTLEIAEKCRSLEIPEIHYALPCIRGAEGGENKYFFDLCLKGWTRLISGKGLDESVYMARLKHEISVISKIGAVRYFLIVWDIVNWAKSHSILCGFGRGSAGGSLVCYLLGIHNLDPIKHRLYFERFLREDRIDMPDIDLDFAGIDRDRVIEYVHERYGKENVCQISTSTRLHGKSAFRDVARVYGVVPLKVNELSKQIDNDLSLEDNFKTVPALNHFQEKHPEIIKHAVRLEGQLRSKGVHPGGVVISESGFDKRGAIEYRKKAYPINWTMDECENFGLLKVDILGLNNLSVLGDTAKFVKDLKGADIDYFSIEPNDPEVLKQFSDGFTSGFFQFESLGITSLCKRLNPINNFETLIHINALYRPGPLDSGMVETYVKRYKKEESIHYDHEKIKNITEAALGVPIFQEDIMRLFVDLAGFSWPEADTMRKIVSKSKGREELEKHREHFTNGCLSVSEIPETVSNKIYDSIVKFGRYGFNRSHSASYSLISYLTAWAKHYHPVEFMCALLRSAVGDTDSTQRYVKEAERIGIRVLPPDINLSGSIYSIVPEDRKAAKFPHTIVCGLSSVKGVGPAAAKGIFNARKKGGGFTSYIEFLARTKRNAVKKNNVIALAKAGAFQKLHPNSRWICETYEDIVKSPKKLPEIMKRKIFDWDEDEKMAMMFEAVPGALNPENIEAEAKMTIDKEVLDLLNAQMKTCEDCSMNENAEPVSFKYARNSRLLVVTDSPGPKEEVKDEPLQNPRMMEMLKDICKLTPGNLFKANLFACRPPGRISEDIMEKKTCSKWLEKIIKATEPQVILSMGSASYSYFSGKKSGILKANGTAGYSPKHKAVVVYSISPGSLFYDSTGEKETMIEDALNKLNNYI